MLIRNFLHKGLQRLYDEGQTKRSARSQREETPQDVDVP